MCQIFLIPVDDSEIALRPVSWVVQNLPTWHEPPAIHLLNVQPSLSGDISRFIDAGTIHNFHLETGMMALSKVRDLLVAAGLSPELHVLIGQAAPPSQNLPMFTAVRRYCSARAAIRVFSAPCWVPSPRK